MRLPSVLTNIAFFGNLKKDHKTNFDIKNLIPNLERLDGRHLANLLFSIHNCRFESNSTENILNILLIKDKLRKLENDQLIEIVKFLEEKSISHVIFDSIFFEITQNHRMEKYKISDLNIVLKAMVDLDITDWKYLMPLLLEFSRKKRVDKMCGSDIITILKLVSNFRCHMKLDGTVLFKKIFVCNVLKSLSVDEFTKVIKGCNLFTTQNPKILDYIYKEVMRKTYSQQPLINNTVILFNGIVHLGIKNITYLQPLIDICLSKRNCAFLFPREIYYITEALKELKIDSAITYPLLHQLCISKIKTSSYQASMCLEHLSYSKNINKFLFIFYLKKLCYKYFQKFRLKDFVTIIKVLGHLKIFIPELMEKISRKIILNQEMINEHHIINIIMTFSKLYYVNSHLLYKFQKNLKESISIRKLKSQDIINLLNSLITMRVFNEHRDLYLIAFLTSDSNLNKSNASEIHKIILILDGLMLKEKSFLYKTFLFVLNNDIISLMKHDNLVDLQFSMLKNCFYDKKLLNKVRYYILVKKWLTRDVSKKIDAFNNILYI